MFFKTCLSTSLEKVTKNGELLGNHVQVDILKLLTALNAARLVKTWLFLLDLDLLVDNLVTARVVMVRKRAIKTAIRVKAHRLFAKSLQVF